MAAGARRLPTVVFCAAIAAACTKSPAGPSDPSSPTLLRGATVSAVDSTPIGGASVQVGAAYAVLSDANGLFQVDVGSAGTFPTNVTSNVAVQHRTSVTGPSADRVRVSLIPLSFDLNAFDQMFRTANARLQRWTTQPALVVVTRTMAFNRASASQFTTVDDQMTDDEVAQLIAHVTEGLTILTGGTYSTFASVDSERPGVGETVTVTRTGKIVVGRYTGVSGFSDIIGYGTWQEQSDGTVTGGSMFLDRDFDRNDARRRLLRIHELGHAPGNVDPDTDPGPVAHGSRYVEGRWAPRIP